MAETQQVASGQRWPLVTQRAPRLGQQDSTHDAAVWEAAMCLRVRSGVSAALWLILSGGFHTSMCTHTGTQFWQNTRVCTRYGLGATGIYSPWYTAPSPRQAARGGSPHDLSATFRTAACSVLQRSCHTHAASYQQTPVRDVTRTKASKTQLSFPQIYSCCSSCPPGVPTSHQTSAPALAHPPPHPLQLLLLGLQSSTETQTPPSSLHLPCHYSGSGP